MGQCPLTGWRGTLRLRFRINYPVKIRRSLPYLVSFCHPNLFRAPKDGAERREKVQAIWAGAAQGLGFSGILISLGCPSHSFFSSLPNCQVLIAKYGGKSWRPPHTNLGGYKYRRPRWS